MSFAVIVFSSHPNESLLNRSGAAMIMLAQQPSLSRTCNQRAQVAPLASERL
jgi:hypothetical protein